MVLAKRLTDAKRKKIIADYVDCENYSAVAKRHKVSRDTVKRVVNADSRTAEIVTLKKEQNTLDVLSYMDSKTASFKVFCDYIMDERLNPETNEEEINKMNIRDLMNAFGIWSDKMLKSTEIMGRKHSGAEYEDLTPLAELINEEDDNTMEQAEPEA